MHEPPEGCLQRDPDEQQIALVRRRLLAWGSRHYRLFPWREGVSPFHGLVAEIMLQRTRAENVVPVFRKFAQAYPDAASVAGADAAEVALIMRPLGLLWRVPLMIQMAAALEERGTIPDTLEELVKLPGVGPYVAAAFMSFHAEGRGVLIDSNIVRWLARITCRPFDAETRRKRWVRELADRVTPAGSTRAFNYAALDFTMTVCVPGIPRCEVCPLGAELCAFGAAKPGEDTSRAD